MYLEIDEKKFNERTEVMRGEAIDAIGAEDAENRLIYNGEEDTVTIESIDDEDGLDISIKAEIPLDTEALIELIAIAVKRMNKFKTVLEALK
jgi:hypothetical protein